MTTTVTKERGILFSGEEVRAILDGRKTQARRVVKPQPREGYRYKGESKNPFLPRNTHTFINGYAHHHIRCPYGKSGDHLYVRETHFFDKDVRYPGDVFYRADYSERDAREAFSNAGDHWKPSIHMPRRASRITLEVTGIRVERVQDISGPDCSAEGKRREDGINDGPLLGEPVWRESISKFAILWDSLNARRGYPWESNPWVWCVEFKRVKRDELPGASVAQGGD